MQTDADRAFEDYVATCNKLAPATHIGTWHAAVAWATARERRADQPAPPADLTADCTRLLPFGTMDDTTYSQIEDILDRCEIDIRRENGDYLKLGERVQILADRTGYRSENAAQAMPTPPTDLVERAARYWREKDSQMQDVHFPDLLAAFAAEYAAECAGETNAERINKTSITRYWKARAESAEQARDEWKARADKLNDYVGTCVPTDEMVGAVAGAIAHEREACAKVAEEYFDNDGIDGQLLRNVAAAIRARKGGE